MSDYITLLGAEDVSRAASRMESAAEQMQRAASAFDHTAERLIRAFESLERAIIEHSPAASHVPVQGSQP